MKTVDGRVIPSSDQLLHGFLKRASWAVNSTNELTLIRQSATSPEVAATAGHPVEIDPQNTLNGIDLTSTVLSEAGLEIRMNWSFQDPREIFPWMFLKLTPRGPGETITIARGLCAPEKTSGLHQEIWRVTSSPVIPTGEYQAEAIFLDYAKLLWTGKSGTRDVQSVRVPLGQIKVGPSGPSGN
jgi:hypothetical protein